MNITPRVVIVMGVSGSGKTTIGRMLAARLGWEFAEGDQFHSPDNVAKMASGVPLNDGDRRPWLESIAEHVDEWRADDRHGVIACSVLKRRYREVVIGDRPDVRLVYLEGDRGLISRRLAARQGHFMPCSLLASQFEALEEPAPEEHAITVSVDQTPIEIVDEIVAALFGGGSEVSRQERSGDPARR